MDAIDFIIEAVKAKTEEGGSLDFVKHVSSTDHETPTDYPAVLALYEPYDYQQIFGQNFRAGLEKQQCRVFSMVTCTDFDAIDDAEHREKAKEAKSNLNKVIDVILEAVRNTNGISGIEFPEPAEKIDSVVGSDSVIYWMVLLELTIKNNS